jgi:hypothetical protein
MVSVGWIEDGSTGTLSGDALWQPTIVAQENLLSKLLGGAPDPSGRQLMTLSGFRPGTFSEFLLSVEITPPGKQDFI